MASEMPVNQMLTIGTGEDGQPFGFPAKQFVTSHGQILAITRKGKTYTSSLFCEQMLKAGIPFVVIDLPGHYWGLKQKHDVLLIGKDNPKADAETSPRHYTDYFLNDDEDIEEQASSVASFIAANNFPAIIDLSHWKYYKLRKFVTEFCNTLYEENKVPRVVIIEEADIVAPQNPITDEQQFSLSAVENIARRGAARGLGLLIVTQRPASVSKNILEQSEYSVVLNLQGAKDMKAFSDLIASDEGFLSEAELESLKESEVKSRLAKAIRKIKSAVKRAAVGQAFVYSPQWLNVRSFVRINQKECYHSGATLGSPDYKTPAEVPVKKFSKVAYVEAELGATADPEPKQESVVYNSAGETMALQKALEQTNAANKDLEARLIAAIDERDNLRAALIQIASLSASITAKPLEQTEASIISTQEPESPISQKQELPTAESENDNGGFGRPEKAILQFLAMREGRSFSVKQIAFFAGYSERTGSFINALSKVSVAGLIIRNGPHNIAVNEEKMKEIEDILGNDYRHPKSYRFSEWGDKLSGPEKKIYEILHSSKDTKFTKDELARKCGYSERTGSFINALSNLSTLGLIVRSQGLIFFSKEFEKRA